MVLTNTLNEDLSDYVGPDVELVVSPMSNAVASATQLTCLQLPTSDALTCSGDSGGHIQRSILRMLRARDYLDFLVFCRPSPPDYMRVFRVWIAWLWLFSHESSFKVPPDCFTMASHRVLSLTTERASHVRKCRRCNEAPLESCGSESSSTASGTSMSGERSIAAILMDHIPRCPCSLYVIQLHDRIVHVLEEFIL
jgi:hypothetical protein